MCKVKSGVNLKNNADLQNMVIGIMLRQRNEFIEQDILDAVNYHSRNAEIYIDQWIVKDLVRDNLNFLLRTNRVRCVDGVYTPLPIEQY